MSRRLGCRMVQSPDMRKAKLPKQVLAITSACWANVRKALDCHKCDVLPIHK